MPIPKTEKKCLICGAIYTTTSAATKYCRKCAKELGIKRKVECMKRSREKAKNKPLHEVRPLGQILREIEAYNQANGTHLTYGQYMAMMKGSGKQ